MKKSYFGIMQPLMFGARKSTPAADPAPVIDSSAIPDLVYFQSTGRLEVKGAVVTGATSMRWQYSSDGVNWTDLGYGTSAELSRDIDWTTDRTLRLKAVNGNSDPVYSKSVSAVCARVHFQNDAANPQPDPTLVQNSPFEYTWTTTAGTKYLSAMLRLWNEQTSNVKRLGMSEATWSTTDANVAPVTSFNTSNGQLRPALKAGTATVTVTFGNLQSKINFIVS